MARIRGVLFDKDGTLVDFEATWREIAWRLALRSARGDEDKAKRRLSAAGYDFALQKFRADSVFAAGTNADVVALWHPRLGPAGRRRKTLEFDAIAAEGASRAVALPGVPEVLSELHKAGLRLGLCTNDSTTAAENTLLALGVAHLFDSVYGYDAVANPKPAPDAIFAFCDLTALQPGEIAVVGDNRHDLLMARAGRAGLAIGVLSGTGTRETLGHLADFVLGSVAELATALRTFEGRTPGPRSAEAGSRF